MMCGGTQQQPVDDDPHTPPMPEILFVAVVAVFRIHHGPQCTGSAVASGASWCYEDVPKYEHHLQS